MTYRKFSDANKGSAVVGDPIPADTLATLTNPPLNPLSAEDKAGAGGEPTPTETLANKAGLAGGSTQVHTTAPGERLVYSRTNDIDIINIFPNRASQPHSLACLDTPAKAAILAKATGDPLLLADGRRLHRFLADRIPAAAPGRARELLNRARAYNAVLVSDGPELIVVERWLGNLPTAGEVIAALRGESRARFDLFHRSLNGQEGKPDGSP